ncbi:NADPH-dependent F420 reductase [Nocardiopsis alkaliphila]|uniref:NADPH-dependent F420 reductase n=1 Tax=Nocardiopsis alkaliphila TaxID=225762 RepID=UPI0004757D8F|nr:NAD(P)-binding domain-containing protein [Nocardiopsis alkaliphila]
MSRILGVIGAGAVGQTVARLAILGGWQVVLSNSRGPQSLADQVARLGPRARAATSTEAAAVGDIVVAATPLIAHTRLPQRELAGKVVIDTMNYTVERDGHLPELDSNELTSSGMVQRHLADSRVVKAFNNITTDHLAALPRPKGVTARTALPIAGDDTGAKKEAEALLDDLGFDAVDVGGLEESWRFGPNTALYALVYAGEEMPEGLHGSEVLQWFLGTPGGPVSAAQVARLAAEAVRGRADVFFDV